MSSATIVFVEVVEEGKLVESSLGHFPVVRFSPLFQNEGRYEFVLHLITVYTKVFYNALSYTLRPRIPVTKHTQKANHSI